MTTITAKNKEGFREAIAQMLTSRSIFMPDYCFYGHMISQCRVIYDFKLKAPAAVNFQNDHFNLFLNSKLFNEFPLEHRIGVLKHEMLHILNNHVERSKELIHKVYNYAADCAINQDIIEGHLPRGCITPNNLPTKVHNVPKKLTAEQYYNMIDKNQIPEDDEYSSHGKWEESEGDPQVQKDIAANMAKNAQTETAKSRGNLPSQYSEWIELLSSKKEVPWQQLLKRVVGNKKANTKKTLLRPDRRSPNSSYIKGRTKDRTFELGIISDVSGSVSTQELLNQWSELISLCKVTSTTPTLIQVDINPSEPEVLTSRTKTINRKASGGTYLSPALDMFKKHGIKYDALVITTDGHLSIEDVTTITMSTKKPIIWLISSDGEIMDTMTNANSKVVKLKG